jgi:hypothetical protein
MKTQKVRLHYQKINQRGKDGKFAVDVKSTSTVKETVAEKTNQEVKVNLSRKT